MGLEGGGHVPWVAAGRDPSARGQACSWVGGGAASSPLPTSRLLGPTADFSLVLLKQTGCNFYLTGSNLCADTLNAVLTLVWLRGEGTEGDGGAGTPRHTLELREGGP